MEGLDLGRGASVGVAVAALVVAIENRAYLRRTLERGQRDLDVVALASVAHLGGALEPHLADADLLAEILRGLGLHGLEPLAHPRDGALIENAGEGLRRIEPCIGQQHAGGREIAGLGRDDDGRDRELVGEGDGVQRTAAAIAEQHKVARVAAVLDGLAADGAGHDHGGDGEDALGELHRALVAGIAEGRRDVLEQGGLGRLHLEHELAAEEAVGRETTEQKVCVGHRRLFAAAAVAHRSGRRSGRTRSDVQPVLLVEPGDGAAARAHLDDVDDRCLDGEALYVAARVIHRIDGKPSIFHQRAFRGGAAHVERDDVVVPQRLGIGRRADAAADGARFHQRDRLAAGAIGREHAAVGTHHEQRAGESARTQFVVEPADIGRHLRADIGVGGHRGGALVLVPLAAELGAAGHIDAGQQLGELGDRALLVLGIGVGVHEGNRDGFDALRLQVPRETAQLAGIQRGDHRAVGADALGHLVAPFARDQRFVALIVQIEWVGAVAARDLQHVAEAAGGDEGRAVAAALDDGVDHQRRTMVDEPRVRRRDAGLAHAFLDPVDEVVIGRRALGEQDAPRLVVEGDEVGKGAADVDGDNVCHG